MKKIAIVVAAFAFVLSAGSVNAFMHDKLQKQLEDAAKQLEQQMQKGQKQPEQKPTSKKSPTPTSGDYEKGMDAARKGDFATAVRKFKPLAEQGHVDAQNNLGLYYAKGKGVPQNYKTAKKWFTLAAEQGFSLAQYNLGLMYFKGNGVPQNDKTAEKWFTLAAKQGHASAKKGLKLVQENIVEQKTVPTVTSMDRNKDIKKMSFTYLRYHMIELCANSGLISNRDLKIQQKRVNKILKGIHFDFADPKISEIEFSKRKDIAFKQSFAEMEGKQDIQMLQFLGLGKENLSRDKMKKLTPFCSGIPNQLDTLESLVDMAYREEEKKKGKTKKRNF